jgi:hypothetical protein
MSAAVKRPKRSNFGEILNNYLLPVPKMLGLIVIGLSTSVIWGVSAMLLKQAAVSATVAVFGPALSVWGLMRLVAAVVGWCATKLTRSDDNQAKKLMKYWGTWLCDILLMTVSLGILQVRLTPAMNDKGNKKEVEYELKFGFRGSPLDHRAGEFLDYTGLLKKKFIPHPEPEDLGDIQRKGHVYFKKEINSNWWHQVSREGSLINGVAPKKAAPDPILFTEALKQTLTLEEEFSMAAWVIDQISKEADKFKKAVFGPKKEAIFAPPNGNRRRLDQMG